MSQVECPGTVQFDQSQTLNTRFNNRKLFTSESSNPSVSQSFAVYLDFEKTVDVFDSIII